MVCLTKSDPFAVLASSYAFLIALQHDMQYLDRITAFHLAIHIEFG
jgi:hypothetical protein